MRFSRSFITAFFATCLIFSGLYAIAFSYQFGAPIPAEYEVYKWRLLKTHLAEKTKGKRIFLVGDSSVLFGMNSKYIEQELGRPVINLALHGGAPLDFNVSMALESARSGDVVIMPLIWIVYYLDYRIPNNWFIDQIVAWGRGYFNNLDPLGKLRYVSAVTPATLYRNITVQENRENVIKANPLRQLKPDHEIITDYFNLHSSQSQFSYSYLNIDLHGDIQRNCGVRITANAPVVPNSLNKETLSYLVDSIKELTARGVKVFVIAQPSVDNATTRSPSYLLALNRIWDTLRERGVPLLGGPTDYYFPPQAFYDTDYHLNCEYSTERSKIIVSALRNVL